ncbi:MAG: hypothetical protein ACI4II_06760 [Acutalibacteraceae bacterium]
MVAEYNINNTTPITTTIDTIDVISFQCSEAVLNMLYIPPAALVAVLSVGLPCAVANIRLLSGINNII